MDNRKGKEFLEYAKGPGDVFAPDDWKINLNADLGREPYEPCPHSLVTRGISPDGRQVDVFQTPRTLEVKGDDPYEIGTVCLDCLIDAMRQLGILTEKDLN